MKIDPWRSCSVCWRSADRCKCTRWDKLKAWLGQPAAVMTAVALLFVAGLVWCILHDREPTYTVPASLCEAHRTGRTRDETVMQCQTNGKNACAYQIPITTTYHEKEVTCKTFSVWE